MLKNYLKIALRNLWRHKAFSFINITGLAVGMAACYLIFSYVRFETSYDRFHSKADRIYRVVTATITPTETINQGSTTGPIAINMKKDFPEVEDAVRVNTDEFLINKGTVKFQEKNTILADSTFLNIFDFPLIAGDRRTALTQPMSVIFSQSAAKKYFGNKDPMGQQVALSGAAIPATITGIMKDIPTNSQIQADVIVSMSSAQKIYGRGSADSEWTNHNYYTYLLLKPNADPNAMQARFGAWMQRHNGEQIKRLQMYDSLSLESLKNVYLRSKLDGFVTGSITNVYIFSIVAIFILVIACINFVNLATARGAERAREVGIRKVVGAGRLQLASQFIGESMIIAFISFLLALILCQITMPLFNQMAGKPIGGNIFQEPSHIGTLFLIALGIGMLAGFYPSLVLSSYKPINVLKGRFATGSRGLLLRRALVVFQFTVSIVLIIGTIVVYRQLNYMRSQDLGFTKDQIIVINTNMDKNKELFRNSLTSIPGVLSTSFSSSVPGTGYSSAYSLIQNKTGAMQQSNIDLGFIDFDYTDQFQLKLAAGRKFSKDIHSDSSQAMLINEAAAKVLGYNTPQEAIGRKFDQWGRKGQIVGVLKDFNYRSLQQKIQPLAMRVETWGFQLISIKVSSRNLSATLHTIEQKWNSTIPNRPFEYDFLDQNFDRLYRSESRFGNLFFNFAILAIFISCLGLLGLASYSTFQRTKEIGVRKILGASVTSIVNLLSVDFIKLVAIAFVIATPIAYFGMHIWLSDFAYRSPLSWQIFAAAGITAVAIAFLTISFQAIRAAITDPVKSLRTE